jgi:hypothetical protein
MGDGVTAGVFPTSPDYRNRLISHITLEYKRGELDVTVNRLTRYEDCCVKMTREVEDLLIWSVLYQ